MPNPITISQLDKLGNTLIYLSKNVGDFNKTKALKLLFLLEENSIKEFGVPFFGFDFKVWKFGPVLEDVYQDLDKPEVPLLNKFIRRVKANREEFEPVSEFNDDEFSNNDLHILEYIVNFARHKKAENLVAYTHRPGSLWDKKVKEYNLKQKFDRNELITTQILIDFSSLFTENEEYLKERYEASLDFLKFHNQLKA